MQIAGSWSEFPGSARAHWSSLTDGDSQAIAGKKKRLVAVIQERYGIPKLTAERQADEWSSGLGDMSGPERPRQNAQTEMAWRRELLIQSAPDLATAIGHMTMGR